MKPTKERQVKLTKSQQDRHIAILGEHLKASNAFGESLWRANENKRKILHRLRKECAMFHIKGCKQIRKLRFVANCCQTNDEILTAMRALRNKR